MNVDEKKKFLKEYADSLKSLTLDELKAKEQEVIAEAEKTDEEVKNTEFELPKENYKSVAEAIRMILDKETVQWQYTLGLVAMYDFWNPAVRPKTVVYPMLDGTLRTLGNQQFKGYTEWAAVVAINKYFEPLRAKYVETSEKVYDVAAKHNAIMDQMNLLDPKAAPGALVNEDDIKEA